MNLCNKCQAYCCRQDKTHAGDAVILDDSEYDFFHNKATLSILTLDGEEHFTIMYKNGKCPFLEGNRCSIYKNRPKQCRLFECWTEAKSGSRKELFLKDNPDLKELIKNEQRIHVN